MPLEPAHACCGVEFAIARTGNWIFLTPLPKHLKVRTWLDLFSPAERSLLRNRHNPDRLAQRQLIETVLHRHLGHDTTAQPAQPGP
jgi:hypothetical protein